MLAMVLRMVHSQANVGNNAIIPTPINNVPKHPIEELFLVLRKIKYPMGITTRAIISPIVTSLPSGSPRLGWS